MSFSDARTQAAELGLPWYDDHTGARAVLEDAALVGGHVRFDPPISDKSDRWQVLAVADSPEPDRYLAVVSIRYTVSGGGGSDNGCPVPLGTKVVPA
jgi:hypothetical protein